MACTLQSVRVERSFDTDYIRQESTDDGIRDEQNPNYIDEFKIHPFDTTPELRISSKNKIFQFSKFHRYTNKILYFIYGSSHSQHRVRAFIIFYLKDDER